MEKKVVDEYLNYYKEFKTRLYLLMKEYEETEDLKIAFYKITGKIELLEELKKRTEGEDR